MLKKLIISLILFSTLNVVGQTVPEMILHKGHLYPITNVKFNHNDKLLLSSDKGNQVIVWNTFLGKQITSFKETNQITTIDFFPESNQIIYATTSNEIKIYSIEKNKIIQTIKWESTINDFCFLQNSKLLIASDELVELDLQTQKSGKIWANTKYQYLLSNIDKQEVLAITSKKSNVILYSSSGKIIYNRYKISRIVSFSTREFKFNKNTINYDFKNHTLYYSHLNNMYGINVETGQVILKKFTDYFDENCTALAYSEKTNTFIFGTTNNTLTIDVLNKVRSKSKNNHLSAISDIKISHNQKYFASASQDNSIIIWDLISHQEIFRLRMSSSPLYSLDVNEFDDIIIGNSIGEIKYIGLNNNKGTPTISNFNSHSNIVSDLKFMDTLIYSVGYDNKIAITNINNSKLTTIKFSKNKKARVLKKHKTKINEFRVKKINSLEFKKSDNSFLIYGVKGKKNKVLKLDLNNSKKHLEKINIEPQKTEINLKTKHICQVVKGFNGKTDFIYASNNALYLVKNATEFLIGKHNDSITDIAILESQNKIVSIGLDGVIKVWNNNITQKTNLIVNLVPLDREKLLIYNEDKYYYSINNAINEVGYKIKEDFYLVEQFDLKYNRPDIILDRLGYADQSLIDAYHKAYLKRLKKMGFTEDMLKDDFHLPELKIENIETLPTLIETGSIDLKLKLNDSKYKLDRINVWVNDVAIYGAGGISLRDKSVKNYNANLRVNLAKGDNKVQVSVLNQAGAESYKETFQLECTIGKTKPNLYLVTIGESEFKQSDFNLTYASKDAKDMASLFEKSKAYENVYTKTLINEQVTKNNVLALKSFLAQADINDQVMVFIAGHGVLDQNLDYFFATYNMDFNNPAEKGLAYEDLEGLLDGIKPLKKTLLIDACHSGEIDKDDVELANNESSEEGDVQFRTVGNSVKSKLGIENTAELTKSLFTDLRKGTGATVISSAGGMEFAMESAEWKNGLFTYCLLNGITTKKADLNKDGEIWLSELQQYVGEQVTKLSGGKQQPTSRIENQVVDFRVW